MCKIANCTPENPCHYCRRQAEKAKPKPLKRTPLKKKAYKIPKQSKKRAKQIRKYSPEVKEWKEQNPYCKAKLSGCTTYTVDCHHMEGKENELLNKKESWLPVCRNCHNKIGVMPIEEQIEKGLSKSKHKKV